MKAGSTESFLLLLTAVRHFYVSGHALITMRRLAIVLFSVCSAMLAAEPKRPFFWSGSLRNGNVFKDERLPFRFVAPVDIVFRIWKEGIFYRFEARSYGSETLQITMTTLRYRRTVPLQAMVTVLSDGCAPDTVKLDEQKGWLQLDCMGPDQSVIRRRLESSHSNPPVLYYFEMITTTMIELQWELNPEFRIVLPPE